MKAQKNDKFKVHTTYQIEKRRDYWKAKRFAILDADGSMCLIVDGMDENTIMILKMRQIVKNMESWFLKSHLCRVTYARFVVGDCMPMSGLMHIIYMIAIKWLRPLCMQLGMYKQGGGNCLQFFESKLTIVGGRTRTSTCVVYV
jgi:hypothetical protein